MSNTNPECLILAIESSCDETSLCLLSVPDFINHSNKENDDLELIRSVKILSSVISSQISIHQQYGGVVPEIGARLHAEQIHFIWQEMLGKIDKNELENLFSEKLKVKSEDFDIQTLVLLLLDKIMVTTNPGLVSALRVGHEFAKSVQFFAEIKKAEVGQDSKLEIREINHLRGHLASSFYIYKTA